MELYYKVKEMLKIFLVVPTIRNLSFLKYWKSEFKNCHLIVIEDNPEFKVLVDNLNFLSVNRYCYTDIKKDFGKEEWIIPRKNAGIRSYGFYKAYQLGADVIITIDDDCYQVETDFVQKHISNLCFKAPSGWMNTYPNPNFFYTRGIPYSNREKISIMISHGLWSGSLDLDAKTEFKIKTSINEKPYPFFRQILPFGYYYPMCSMNLAFKRQVVPLMFFPMMGQDSEGNKWKYDRYDDIWAGIFSKKIMDHLNLGVINGSPFVEHKKASNVSDNLKKEKKAMRVNEILWKKVDEVKLTKRNPKDCYIELAKKIKFPKEEYFEKLREAMIIWANLF